MAMPKVHTFSPELAELIAAAIDRTGGEFPTLGSRPVVNLVVDFQPAGVWVVTAKRSDGDDPPALVPAWMLHLAWEVLQERGRLSNQALLSELKVMRSSAVCAILAQLPGVQVQPGRGVVLRWVGPARGQA